MAFGLQQLKHWHPYLAPLHPPSGETQDGAKTGDMTRTILDDTNGEHAKWHNNEDKQGHQAGKAKSSYLRICWCGFWLSAVSSSTSSSSSSTSAGSSIRFLKFTRDHYKGPWRSRRLSLRRVIYFIWAIEKRN